MQRPDPHGHIVRIVCRGVRAWAVRVNEHEHRCQRCGKRVKVAW